MTAIDPLAALNTPQRRAVTYGQPLADGKGVRAGPLLVVAGAGTGKTDTIAHRVAWLAMNGVDPGRMMLLTFTRRAAAQMRRRAHDILRQALDDTLGNKSQAMLQRLIWAGTFHSIGNRLLRHYGRHLKLDPGFSVIDRSDSADLFDNLRQELGLTEQYQRFPRKDTCLAIYSWRVNTQKSLHDTLEQQFSWCLGWEQELAKLCRAYVERKQRCGLLDYDDLLVYWQAMMTEPRLAQQVGSNFDHVLVDEYQDTNRLQGEIVHGLRPDGAGVTVVGDDAQSIYSFRGTVVENILNFPDTYTPKAEIITLAQNYRATQPILDVANALMADAPRQHRKHLLSVRGAGGRPQYVTADELQSQAEYVCGQVLKRREAGVPLRRQAVLFRNASASDILEVELLHRKIPFVKYGGLKFIDAAHVKDLLAVLRWADNPRNALAAFRVLQLLPGMGPAHAQRIVTEFEQGGGSFKLLAEIKKPAAALLDLVKLSKLMVMLTEPQRPWPGQLRLVRDWYQPHLERMHEQTHTRNGDLDQLEQISAMFPVARALHHRTGARPAQRRRRPVGRPAPGRGLPGALDRAFRQGHGMGHGVRAQRRRRQLPLGILHRPRRPDRRGAPAAVRGHDPRPQRAAPVRAAQVPADAAAARTATPTSTARAAASSPRKCSSAASSRPSRDRTPPR